MDRPNWFTKWKSSKTASPAHVVKWAGVVIVLAVVWLAFHSGAVHVKANAAPSEVPVADNAGKKTLWETYRAAYNSAEDKVSEIQRALDENERLRYENANLRVKLETAQFSCLENQTLENTQKAGAQASAQGGSRVARTLANIPYKVPETLLPGQLYTLGITYFKAHEDEKAAVIFSFLTGMEDNTVFQNARNYLMTGVAWYRVDNFEKADQYFDKTLKEADVEANLPFQAQARLWKSLIAKHQGKESETQYWLKDLVDHHPHSEEAAWVNSTEAKREPATQPEQ
jgi:tetratricopeptide (TPR) repeat protein